MELSLLRTLGTIKHFDKDTFIFIEGEVQEWMYIIIKGQVRIYVGSFVNEPIEIAILNPGSFFGEMALLNNAPRSATVCALEDDTIVIELSKENFYLLIQKQEDISFRILSTLSQRVQNSLNQLSADSPLKMIHETEPFYSLIIHSEADAIRDAITNNAYNPLEVLQYFSQLLLDIDTELVKNTELSCNNISNYIDIVPKEQRTYFYAIDDTYKAHTLEKEMKCPICGQTHTQLIIKQSSIKLEKITIDMRSIYSPIDPIWFELATCPNCLYTNYAHQFEKIPPKFIAPTKEALVQANTLKPILDLETPNINTIFAKYYLAILCSTSPYYRDFKLGKLWLSLAWLYSDVGDEKLFETAYSSASEYYEKIFSGSSIELSSSEEQKLYMILAAFKCHEGNWKDAQRLYFDVTRIPNGNRMIEDMAREELFEIKSHMGKEE